MAGAGVTRPTVVTAAATPSSRRRLSKGDACIGNPPISPRDAIASRNWPNKPDRFKSSKWLENYPHITARRLKHSIICSPFALADRGILRHRELLAPRQVAPNLLITVIWVATELHRSVRFDVSRLVDNKNRHWGR